MKLSKRRECKYNREYWYCECPPDVRTLGRYPNGMALCKTKFCPFEPAGQKDTVESPGNSTQQPQAKT